AGARIARALAATARRAPLLTPLLVHGSRGDLLRARRARTAILQSFLDVLVLPLVLRRPLRHSTAWCETGERRTLRWTGHDVSRHVCDLRNGSSRLPRRHDAGVTTSWLTTRYPFALSRAICSASCFCAAVGTAPFR